MKRHCDTSGRKVKEGMPLVSSSLGGVRLTAARARVFLKSFCVRSEILFRKGIRRAVRGEGESQTKAVHLKPKIETPPPVGLPPTSLLAPSVGTPKNPNSEQTRYPNSVGRRVSPATLVSGTRSVGRNFFRGYPHNESGVSVKGSYQTSPKRNAWLSRVGQLVSKKLGARSSAPRRVSSSSVQRW